MKWKYIDRIGKLGAACGIDGVLELLIWCDRPNTASVTLEEAQAFCEQLTERAGSKKLPDRKEIKYYHRR